jgi:hypothetical protein
MAQAMDAGVRPMLRSMQTVHFSIADGPWVNQPGRTYVVGSSLALGAWDPGSGIQLAPRPKSGSTISSTVWTLTRHTMEAVIQVLDEDNLETRYFFIPDQEASIIWEQLTRKAKAQMPPLHSTQPDMFTPAPPVWGIP